MRRLFLLLVTMSLLACSDGDERENDASERADDCKGCGGNEAGGTTGTGSSGEGGSDAGSGGKGGSDAGSGGTGGSDPDVDYDPLRTVSNCKELESALKADARERLRRMFTQVDDGSGGTGGGWGGEGGGDWGGDGGGAGSGGGGGDGDGSGGTGTGGSGASTGSDSHSTTNTQIDGVDEGDFIKNDGEWIYVVRDGLLYVSQAWPVTDLKLAATETMEGNPFEMYVIENDDDGGLTGQRTVIVYSAVDGTAVYERAGMDPPDWGRKLERGYTGEGAQRADSRALGIHQTGTGSYPEVFGMGASGFWHANPLTKVSILTGKPSTLSLRKAFYLQGSHVSSRRIGATLRTALELNPPSLPFTLYLDEDERMKAELVLITRLLDEGRDVEDIPADELAKLLDEVMRDMIIEKNEKIIDALEYEDWLPFMFHEEKGKMTALAVACDALHLPPPAAGDGGLTHVAEIDIEELSASSLGLLGRSETLYENASSFILAAQGWNGAEAVTNVHWFTHEPGSSLVYKASGSVPGTVDGQFAFDEANGALRIATTVDQPTENFVSVLQAKGRLLAVEGQVGPLARGERIYSVRYVGDTAYVVTFRQTDPLFVIDLSDPKKPRLLGEAKIPGFSEYMHPLGKTHLFTVGVDGDEQGNLGNVAVQIFDVSDPAKPKLAHKYAFDKFGESEGLVTHKAVTYFAEKGLLALPFSGYNPDSSLTSSIELFHMDPKTGIEHRGALSGLGLATDAEQPDSGYECYWGAREATRLRRAIFIDDVLCGVSYRGIVAAQVDSLEVPVASLGFEDADFVPGYCYPSDDCGYTSGTGGGDCGGEGGFGGFGGSEGGSGGFGGGSGGSEGGVGGSGEGGFGGSEDRP